ncbi:MAG: HAD family hydrolase [Candidatus Electrothrix sp. Rat3]|nr:HAD family hydrolase [Candidatus Electrothrix rattekaaiensis]
MIIKGLIFDINGTVTDINTNEWHSEIYRVLSNLLLYQGISLSEQEVRDLYNRLLKSQRKAGGEQHPEFNATGIFQEIIDQHATAYTLNLPAAKLEQLPLFLAETFRAASLFRLKRYRGVTDTIKELHQHYQLAALSDGQTAWAVPELRAVGLLDYFSPVVVSGDHGFRKPDQRLFAMTLEAMQLQPEEVLFVGNDMYRDVFGAQQFGLKTVFFQSNQGRQKYEGTEPDYIIYNFPELLNAVRFFTDQPRVDLLE